ncbi:MAG: RNA methyltransferase [Anaerolineae bacterium]|nr:RNA methyltransferase [Anaerolineae bacterium]
MISSKSNKQIKLIRRLQTRKAREETGLFVVEGIQAVVEALAYPDRVEMVVVCPDLLTSAIGYEAVRRAAHAPDIHVLETTGAVFESIASREHPQGIAAVVRQQWHHLEQTGRASDPLWVALDAVQYPGNLGTILRTCDAVGASGVILLDAAADPYHPTAVRAARNAIFTQKLVHTDFDSFAHWKQRTGYQLVGASGDAPCAYRDIAYPLPMILLLGSEGEGLASQRRALCDAAVSIPMRGRSDSLNVAVAAAVILYEILAQNP